MKTLSRTPGGWKSRTLWAFFILCLLTLAFLAVYVWIAYRVLDLSYQLAIQGKTTPPVFSILIQALPVAAAVTGTGAAGVAFIGGNKARDAFSHFNKNRGGCNETNTDRNTGDITHGGTCPGGGDQL